MDEVRPLTELKNMIKIRHVPPPRTKFSTSRNTTQVSLLTMMVGKESVEALFEFNSERDGTGTRGVQVKLRVLGLDDYHIVQAHLNGRIVQFGPNPNHTTYSNSMFSRYLRETGCYYTEPRFYLFPVSELVNTCMALLKK